MASVLSVTPTSRRRCGAPLSSISVSPYAERTYPNGLPHPLHPNTQHGRQACIKSDAAAFALKRKNRPQHQGIGKPVWHVIMAAQRISERVTAATGELAKA